MPTPDKGLQTAFQGNLDSTSPHTYNRDEVNRKKKTALTRKSAVLFAFFVVFVIILPLPAYPQDGDIELKVVADQANIRLEPDISSIIILQVSKGTILKATEKKEDWFAVQIPSKEGTVVSGFVHESLVIALQPFPEEKSPPPTPEKKTVEYEKAVPISTSQVTLSVSAGGNYARGGDLNSGMEGLADLYEDSLGIQGKGNIGAAHLGYVLGMEVSFPLSGKISWGLGVEHFLGKNKSQVEYSQGASFSLLDVRPKFSATPLHASLSFNATPELYLKGGISYYLSRCSYSYAVETDGGVQSWTGKANGGGFGLMGAIGYAKQYSETMSFFTEITGRLARIKGFTGNEEYQDKSGGISTEEGTLYLIQKQVLEERAHPVLFIREKRPNEVGVISVSEARIDFSGMGLKIGLRLRF